MVREQGQAYKDKEKLQLWSEDNGQNISFPGQGSISQLIAARRKEIQTPRSLGEESSFRGMLAALEKGRSYASPEGWNVTTMAMMVIRW